MGKLLCKDRYFLMKLGAFYDLFRSEDHPWHAFPDLPRPLASLGRYPGQSIEEKETCSSFNNFFMLKDRV